MKLSDEMFNEVCAALGAGGGSETDVVGPSQRRAARRRVDARVEVEPPNPTCAPRSVLVQDVSPGGACLIDDRTMAPGEKLTLRLPVDADRSVPVLCVVQNCRLTRDGRFRVGVEFLGQAEVGARGPTLAPGARGLRPINLPALYGDGQDGPDGGDGPAAAGRAQLQTYDTDGTGGLVCEAAVVDFCDTGAGFTCGTPLPVGQRLVARVHLPGHEPATHLYTVVSARPLDDGTHRLEADRISWTPPFAGDGGGLRGVRRLFYWLR